MNNVFKKVFLGVIFALITSVNYCQQNNPYNLDGQNAYSDAVFLVNEIKSGKITQYSDEVLKSYKSQLKSNIELSETLVSEIFSKVISKDTRYTQFAETHEGNEKLKSESIIIENLYYAHSSQEFTELISVEVNRVLNDETISEIEKKEILTTYAFANAARNMDCQVNGGPSPCGATTGAIIGGTIGSFFGPWATAGGLVVGWIVGSLFDK